MLFKNITIFDENYIPVLNQNVLVENEFITYIGKAIPLEYKGEVYNGIGKVLVPSFFNIHCHVPMSLLRGYGEGLPLARWLHEKVFPFEDLLQGDDFYWGTMLGVSEFIRTGTASFTDMYMGMEDVLRAVEESGIKANLSHGAVSFDTTQAYAQTNSYRGLSHLIKNIKGDGKIKADASIHAEYTSHEGVVRGVSDYAKENNLAIHLHLSETEKEHEECKTRHNNMTPTEWFSHCGVFDSPVTAAHSVFIEGEDFNILKRNGATVASCPVSNLKLGSGIAPIKEMVEKGVLVGFGTDGASSNNSLDMLKDLNIAALLHKGVNQDPAFLSPSQILKMCCQNGARSQQRADCGAIKTGNRADVTVFDFDKAHIQPIYDVGSALLYAANSSDIVLSMVDGKVLYQDGEYKTLDIEKIVFNSNRIVSEKLELLKK